MCTADIVMNSKAEWNGSRIPRIIIEEREKQTEDRNSGMSKTTGENRKRSLKLREAQKRSIETGEERGEKRMRKEIESEVDQNRGDHSIKRGERAEMRIKWRQTESRKKHIERRRKTVKEEKSCTNTQKKSEMKRYWQEKFKQMAERNREKNGEKINLLPDITGENRNTEGETVRLEGINTVTQEKATPEIETEAEMNRKRA